MSDWMPSRDHGTQRREIEILALAYVEPMKASVADGCYLSEIFFRITYRSWPAPFTGSSPSNHCGRVDC